MSKTVQTITTLTVKVATSPLGDSGSSLVPIVEEALKKAPYLGCPRPYSIEVELVSEKEELVDVAGSEEDEEPVLSHA